MTALTSLLVRDQRVSVRQIEEAIQKQVIRGGALEEVLLDLEVVPENVLCAYQAVLAGLSALDRDEVMNVPPAILQRVPRELAIAERVVPVKEESGKLVLAVSVAKSPDEQRALSEALGGGLLFRFVIAPRLSAALFAHYDADVPAGLVRLLEELANREAGELPYVRPPGGTSLSPHSAPAPDPVPAVPPAPERQAKEVEPAEATPEPSNAQKRESVPTERDLPAFRKTRNEKDTLPETAAQSQVETAADAGSTQASEDERPSKGLSTRVRGALTPKRAMEELQHAEERDKALEVVLLFARQYFDFTAIFAVRGGELHGLLAYDGAVGEQDVTTVSIPADAAAAFATVQAFPGPKVLDTSTAIAGELAETLQRGALQPAFLAPITLRGRTVLLLYGDRSGEDFQVSELPELLALLPRVGETFQRIIVNKKRRVGYTTPQDTPAQEKPKLPAKTRMGMPAVRTEPESSERGETPYRPGDAQRTGRIPKDTLWKLAAERSAPPPPPSDRPQNTPSVRESAPATNVERTLDPGSTGEAERGRKRRPSSTVYKLSDVPAEVVRRSDLVAAPTRSSATPAPTAPADERGSATHVDHTQLGRTAAAIKPEYDREHHLPPAAPARRADSDSAGVDDSKKRERRQESDPTVGANEPKIIVAMDGSFDVSVDALLRCDRDSCEREIERLLEVGEAALPALVQQFPGELWISRKHCRPPYPWAGDVSAVARALVAFGRTAASYVVSLMRRDDDDVRFFATLVAADVRCPEIVPELSNRVLDQDKQIQSVAIAALPRFVGFHAEMHAALEFFRLKARATTHAPADRRAAVTALASCRDVTALNILLDLLGSPDDVLAGTAYDALVAITCQDFGGSQEDWGHWMRGNLSRHRVEWLIESLNHKDPYLRAHAGEELKEVTQEYFGYVPNAPARDRDVAQRKYQTWWDQEGRFRFQARP